MRNIPIGPGFWKFNSSLLNNETFKINLRDFIKNTKSKLNFNDTQLNWELLKHEIRKFIISYSKVIAKEERARRLKLENTLKFLENNLTDNLKKQQYELLKCELDEIYDKIAEGVRVRSRCQQYEEGEKSNKFFLNLEKVRGSQGKVRKLIVSNHEIANPQLNQLFFYKNLFKNNIKKTLSEQTNFLNTLQIPKLSDNDCLLCEGELFESELYDALKNMPNNKSPGNGGLTKEFFLSFWDDIKDIYISSIRTTGIKKEFSVSQRQAIIKLIEKKIKIKDLLKIGDPFHY